MMRDKRDRGEDFWWRVRCRGQDRESFGTKPMARRRQRFGAPAITQFMGGSPEERVQRYRGCSPVEMLPLGVPQEIFAPPRRPPTSTPPNAPSTTANAAVAVQSSHFVFIEDHTPGHR
jgi:hypothetical protein